MHRPVLLGRHAGDSLELLMKVGGAGKTALFRHVPYGVGGGRKQLFCQFNPFILNICGQRLAGFFMKKKRYIIGIHMNLIGDKCAVQFCFPDVCGNAVFDFGQKGGFRRGNIHPGLAQPYGFDGAFQFFCQYIRRCRLQNIAKAMKLHCPLGIIKLRMPGEVQ